MSGTEKQQSKYKLVKFVDKVEEFLDMEGETVGPFEKGEIANLDFEIADLLTQDKKVEIIEQD